MKKLFKIFWILIFISIFFKMLDERNYTRLKPLIESLKIYNKKGTDTYYLVYNFDNSIKSLKGARVFLHGIPINSEVKLLPENRQKYNFDNWDFTLDKLEENIYVRSINSKAKNYTSLNFGIYRLSDNTVLEGKDRRLGSIKNIDLNKAAIVDQLDITDLPETELTYNKKELKSFGYYKKLENIPSSITIIFLSLLLMAGCIVGYSEKIIKEEYRDKKDFLKVLTLIIVGIYPIFIFLKRGAISTVVDVLLGILIIQFIMKEKPKSSSNIIIYILLMITFAWWQYATVTGLDPDSGRQWYKGIIIKYMYLPILLCMVQIRWEMIKKIFWIYMFASVPYWKFFIENFNKPRFGADWDTQHMAQMACGFSILSLIYILFGKLDFKKKILFYLLFIFSSIMVLKSGVRGIWIAYAAIIPLLLMMKNFKRSLIGVIILVLGMFKVMNYMPNNYYVERIKSLERLEGGNRLAMWSIAPNIIKENPIDGIGIKSFKKYFTENEVLVKREEVLKEKLKLEKEKKPQNINEVKGIEKQLNIRERMKYESVHIHNTYLEVLISTGLVGFILYYTLFSIMLWRIYNKGKESIYINEKLFFYWIITVNIMQLIYGLTEYTLVIQIPQQSIWFFMALALNYEVKRDER